jgi:hypothetical protein
MVSPQNLSAGGLAKAVRSLANTIGQLRTQLLKWLVETYYRASVFTHTRRHEDKRGVPGREGRSSR